MRVKSRLLMGVAALVAGTLLYGAATAHAQPVPPWRQTASACAVDEGSLNKFAFSGPNFSFLAGQTSDRGVINNTPVTFPIIVRCHVSNPLGPSDYTPDVHYWEHPDWNDLVVGYQDPDGTGSAYSVVVRLFEVSLFDGSQSVVATFKSNDSNSTGVGRAHTVFAESGSSPINFLSNDYYVQIELIRTNTKGNPKVYSVALENAPSL